MRLILVIIGSLLCGLTFVHSFRIPNSPEWNEMDMFKSMGGQKQMSFLDTVYPSSKINKIGQVGGVDAMPNGDLLVFQRGGRTWTYDTFNGNDFNQALGPIAQNTIDLIDTKKFQKINSWGAGQFYMPHGLTVDSEGNVWVTDVGLQQVFKYEFGQFDKPLLTLGERFKTGSDASHFCKPTDVAESENNGHIFVSDGYCNSRVVEFDKTGKFVKQFEDTDKPMFVVHSVTVVDPLNYVCVASREDGRIVCFDIDSGKKKAEISQAGMNTVYAVKYDPVDEVLHAATGENHRKGGFGFTFDASKDNFGDFIQKWEADKRDLSQVHDLTISPSGTKVYMGQLNGEIDLMSYE